MFTEIHFAAPTVQWEGPCWGAAYVHWHYHGHFIGPTATIPWRNHENVYLLSSYNHSLSLACKNEVRLGFILQVLKCHDLYENKSSLCSFICFQLTVDFLFFFTPWFYHGILEQRQKINLTAWWWPSLITELREFSSLFVAEAPGRYFEIRDSVEVSTTEFWNKDRR